MSDELRRLAEDWQHRADDCGSLSRLVLIELASIDIARAALRELAREFEEKYVRIANECAREAQDGYFSDYLDFEEGRREAFKWAAERARVLAAGGEPPDA